MTQMLCLYIQGQGTSTTPKHYPTGMAGWDPLSRLTEQITTAPAEVMTGSGN